MSSLINFIRLKVYRIKLDHLCQTNHFVQSVKLICYDDATYDFINLYLGMLQIELGHTHADVLRLQDVHGFTSSTNLLIRGATCLRTKVSS